MNKFFIFTVSLMALASQAKAEYLTMSCLSQTSPNRELTLFIENGNIKRIDVQLNGSLPSALMVSKLANQNIEELTLYSIQSVASLMEVENKVLTGQTGTLRINYDSFFCL